MRRLWRWLWHRSDERRLRERMEREETHRAELESAARLERQQEEIVHRLRRLGIEVDVYRHRQDRDES